jgi:hypothetical protein
MSLGLSLKYLFLHSVFFFKGSPEEHARQADAGDGQADAGDETGWYAMGEDTYFKLPDGSFYDVTTKQIGRIYTEEELEDI